MSDPRVVAFVNFTGLGSDGSWPATAASMASALEAAGNTVIRIRPIGTENPLFWRAIQAIYRMAGIRFHGDRQEKVVRKLSLSVKEQLQGHRPDLVLCSSSLPVPFLDVNVPVAFWTDATFNGMLDFYPEFSKLSRTTRRNGAFYETLALRRAQLAVYSSEWAARSAIQDHGADPAKVHVIPFGPNLSGIPSREDVYRSIAERSRTECHLLFIGYDWERKRGPLVLKVHRSLRERGIDSRLTVIGCEPDISRQDRDGVDLVGRIDKSDPVQKERFLQLLRSAHFLVLPSKAECYGIVYAEASAFGIPSVGCDTGGVPSAILHGVNGWLFPAEVAPVTIADQLLSIWSDPDRYDAAAHAARKDHEERTDWNVGVRSLMQKIDALALSRITKVPA